MSPKSKTRKGRRPYRPKVDATPPEPSHAPRRSEVFLRGLSLVIAIGAGGMIALSGLTALMDMNTTLLTNTVFTALATGFAAWLTAKSLKLRRTKTVAVVSGAGVALLLASLMHPMLQAASQPLVTLFLLSGAIHVRLRVLAKG